MRAAAEPHPPGPSPFQPDAQFAAEQAALRHVWTMVGTTADLARDGDWITVDLWGCPVFIQRFSDAFRGFVNLCAHRFYPLRIGVKGNGPIRCGFHGWQYDADGIAVDIPLCEPLFHMTVQEMNARLKPVEVAVCGELLFARLPGVATESLEEFLADFAPIIARLSLGIGASVQDHMNVEASWKFSFHISLDDYHIVAVHPGTFGAGGHLKPGRYRYFRSGAHSALFSGGDVSDQALERMRIQCADGSYRGVGYRIFHVFPNLSLLHYLFRGRWYIIVIQHVAAGRQKTLVRNWIYPAAFPTPPQRFGDLRNRLQDWPRALLLRYGTRRILGEDRDVCEALQTVADHASDRPRLGGQESRIAWFNVALTRAVAAAGRAESEAAPPRRGSERAR